MYPSQSQQRLSKGDREERGAGVGPRHWWTSQRVRTKRRSSEFPQQNQTSPPQPKGRTGEGGEEGLFGELAGCSEGLRLCQPPHRQKLKAFMNIHGKLTVIQLCHSRVNSFLAPSLAPKGTGCRDVNLVEHPSMCVCTFTCAVCVCGFWDDEFPTKSICLSPSATWGFSAFLPFCETGMSLNSKFGSQAKKGQGS